jgi:hypothetical protein
MVRRAAKDLGKQCLAIFDNRSDRIMILIDVEEREPEVFLEIP